MFGFLKKSKKQKQDVKGKATVSLKDEMNKPVEHNRKRLHTNIVVFKDTITDGDKQFNYTIFKDSEKFIHCFSYKTLLICRSEPHSAWTAIKRRIKGLGNA